MKKLFALFLGLFAVYSLVTADNDKPIRVSELPTKAQLFLTTHFKDKKVALAKVENDLLDKTYDVVFTDGEKLEFDKAGEWKEVECKTSGVPASIVPAAILQYVKEHYDGQRILSIERDRKDTEIRLSNGLEIKFDKKNRVIDID